MIFPAYSGSKINIQDMGLTWDKHYIFSITQYQFLENDPVRIITSP